MHDVWRQCSDQLPVLYVTLVTPQGSAVSARADQVMLVDPHRAWTPPAADDLSSKDLRDRGRLMTARDYCGAKEEIELGRRTHHLEAGLIQVGLASLQWRFQTAALHALLIGPSAARALIDPEDPAAPTALQDSLAEGVRRSRDAADRQLLVCVVLHVGDTAGCAGHYTLLTLRRDSLACPWTAEHRDSLRSPSVASLAAAQMACLRLGASLSVDVHNREWQSDSWSCGLWTLRWIERALRDLRGEGTRCKPFAAMASLGALNRLALSLNKLVAPSASGSGRPSGDSVCGWKPPPPPQDYQDALARAALCTKCRMQGCRWCMGDWFVPRVEQQGWLSALTAADTGAIVK